MPDELQRGWIWLSRTNSKMFIYWYMISANVFKGFHNFFSENHRLQLMSLININTANWVSKSPHRSSIWGWSSQSYPGLIEQSSVLYSFVIIALWCVPNMKHEAQNCITPLIAHNRQKLPKIKVLQSQSTYLQQSHLCCLDEGSLFCKVRSYRARHLLSFRNI